jgi:dipeptidase E
VDKLNMLLFGGGQSEKRQPYYEYCHDWLQNYLTQHLPANPKIMFISWAIWGGHDEDKMFAYGQEHWRSFGLNLTSLHQQPDYFEAIGEADAIIVGGGSIHSLVDKLEKNHLMAPLRERIQQGCIYVGTSAGAIIAGPTMHTAGEPPLIHIMSHKTLDIVPFQVTAHYYDIGPDQFHPGPPPEARIKNYLRLNPHPAPVACLRDGAILHIENGKVMVQGIKPVTIFDRKLQRLDFEPGTEIPLLLNYRSKFYRQ